MITENCPFQRTGTGGKIVLTAILGCFGIIAFMLENLLPTIILPGARLGLSNIFVLLALIWLGLRYAAAVVTVKTVLGSLLCGNPFAIVFSLPAGILSLIVIFLFLKYVYPKISPVAVSVIGAVVNCFVQTGVYCLITATPQYFIYMGFLGIVGTVGGIIVGVLTVTACSLFSKPRQ